MKYPRYWTLKLTKIATSSNNEIWKVFSQKKNKVALALIRIQIAKFTGNGRYFRKKTKSPRHFAGFWGPNRWFNRKMSVINLFILFNSRFWELEFWFYLVCSLNESKIKIRVQIAKFTGNGKYFCKKTKALCGLLRPKPLV